MVLLNKVRYKNFLSSGNQFIEVDLSKNATTLIVGFNGNGKTSFIDAITFCLFGKPFRNINKPGLVNSINGRDCEAEIEFSVGKKKYKVRRGIKPTIFEIYESGKLVDQESKSKDYQKYLEENILKLNYKSFCQIIVLGTANFIPFMQLSAADRRYIIEDLLDIRVFSNMNILLKEKSSLLRDTLNEVDNRIEIDGEKLKLHKKFLLESKTSKNQKIKDNKIKIKDNKNNKKEIQSSVDILQKVVNKLLQKVKDYDIIKIQLNKFNLTKLQTEQTIQKLTEEVEYYADTTQCGECKQSIESNFRNSMVIQKKEKISTIQDKLKVLEKKIDSKTKTCKDIGHFQRKINETQTEINKLNGQISSIDRIISHIEQENSTILKVKEQSTKIKESELEELEENKFKLEESKKELVEKRYIFDIVSVMLKDSGIKTRIIKQYLPIMNKLINKYLNLLNLFVNFNLDESFKEVIKSRNKEDYSYESFSGGERTKINLAILFAWREIAKMKNSANTNLLIFDEIMDSSLDNEGLDDFVKLIQTVTKGTNVFVISHRNAESMSDKFDAVVKFQKVKGFTVKETLV